MNTLLTKSDVEKMIDQILDQRQIEVKEEIYSEDTSLLLGKEQIDILQKILGKKIDIEQFVRLCIMTIAEIAYIAPHDEKFNLSRLSLSNEQVRGVFTRSKYPAVVVLQALIEIVKIHSEKIIKKSNRQIFDVLAENNVLKLKLQSKEEENKKLFQDITELKKSLESQWVDD